MARAAADGLVASDTSLVEQEADEESIILDFRSAGLICGGGCDDGERGAVLVFFGPMYDSAVPEDALGISVSLIPARIRFIRPFPLAPKQVLGFPLYKVYLPRPLPIKVARCRCIR